MAHIIKFCKSPLNPILIRSNLGCKPFIGIHSYVRTPGQWAFLCGEPSLTVLCKLFSLLSVVLLYFLQNFSSNHIIKALSMTFIIHCRYHDQHPTTLSLPKSVAICQLFWIDRTCLAFFFFFLSHKPRLI